MPPPASPGLSSDVSHPFGGHDTAAQPKYIVHGQQCRACHLCWETAPQTRDIDFLVFTRCRRQAHWVQGPPILFECLSLVALAAVRAPEYFGVALPNMVTSHLLPFLHQTRIVVCCQLEQSLKRRPADWHLHQDYLLVCWVTRGPKR